MVRSMSRLAAVAFVLSLIVPASFAQPADSTERYVMLPLNISLVPPISMGDAVSGAADVQVINRVSFNIIAGRAARLEGVEFGGVFNAYKESVTGAQFGGAVNVNGGDALAAQFAGLTNIVGGRADGAQFAGLTNINAGSVRGAQFAGLLNINGGDFTGSQFAGLVNINGGRSVGLQSGIVNIAPAVSGVQLGVVNISDTNDGVPIGVVSYVRSYGFRYDAWADESGIATVSLRSGSRRVSNHLAFGARVVGRDFYWGPAVGLGAEFPLSGGRFAAIDLIGYGLFNGDGAEDAVTLSKLRLLFGIQAAGRLSLFAGPTFNVLVGDSEGGTTDLAPWTVYDYTSEDVFVKLWPGAVVGLRLR